MNRHAFLWRLPGRIIGHGLGWAVLMAATTGVLSGAETASAPKPNILFLLADDWAWPHASCLGAPGINTPTFDRLVREGVLFRNAHTAAPSCSPARAAMLTGQWHWRLEQGSALRGFLPAKYPVYPDLLEAAGYHVGFTGKGYAPAGLGDRRRNPCGPSYASFGAFLKARPRGQPFCFWFGSHQPHRPYVWESGVKAGLDPAKVLVPPYLPDNPTVRKDITDYFSAAETFDRQAGEVLVALEQSGELEHTLIVMSGDNGWPFPRSKATCYDSGTHQPLAIRWGAKVKGGRVVEDLVNLADLAPTFLEVAGLTVPKDMTARSLLPVLLAGKSGQVDPARDHTLTGMEVHAPCRALDQGGKGGYPMRTLITKDFHYLRNFRPERWPAGDPANDPAALSNYDVLARNTGRSFGDIDASPTKAWMVVHREEPAIQPLAAMAWGKRPARQLFDLRRDPFELTNVAEDPGYAEVVQKLDTQLMAELKATGDPRATGQGDEFDRYGQSAGSRPNPVGLPTF